MIYLENIIFHLKKAPAGHHDAALVDDMLADLGVEAGSNDEGSTGSHSAVSLINGQDSAGAQQDVYKRQPYADLLRQIKAELSLPVRCLMRPRAGDFLYTQAEICLLYTSLTSSYSK